MVVCERADEVAEYVAKNKESEVIAWELELKDGEVSKIAENLKKNTALVKLVLYECNIGEQGGMELANALEVNKTLREFDYVGNSIGGVANAKIRDVWNRTRMQWKDDIKVSGGRNVTFEFAKKIGVRKDPKKQIKVTQFQWAVSELQTKKVKGLPALNSSPSAVRR